MITIDVLKLFGLALSALHVLGTITALFAIMRTRTAQGATAWAISLVTFPYIALPMYWVFGRNRFRGYLAARQAGKLDMARISRQLGQRSREFAAAFEAEHEWSRVMEHLAGLPITRCNSATILVNGEATFDAIEAGLDRAKKYILFQFFIIKNDGLGQRMATALKRAAARGVVVRVLYDEIGSKDLPESYAQDLRDNNVETLPFHTTKGWTNTFQVNFRNHRKIVIIDGCEAFVGGHNVGDEYMGLCPPLAPWRDTHVRVVGPAALGAQLAFVEDWKWASGHEPEVDWTPHTSEAPELECQDVPTLALPTGPADSMETGSLFYTAAISAAQERVWIASPYFVPDSRVMGALQLAAMRGVDVRVILPQKRDHLLVKLASYDFIHDATKAGVKVLRYQPGFMHQKVIVVDNTFSAIGTANMDNRSYRLNFEIMMIFANRDMNAKTAEMLEDDMTRCVEVPHTELENKHFLFRLAVRVARLFAPAL